MIYYIAACTGRITEPADNMKKGKMCQSKLNSSNS